MKRKDTIPLLFDRLVRLSNRLAGPQGCPWDKAQTHKSLRNDLIEEAYEVVEAIDEKDSQKLKDELGDILYQVIFHSDIARKRKTFTLEDVLANTYEKMVRRHPHVFKKEKKVNTEEVLTRWQEMKKAEKKEKTHAAIMANLPKSLPALLRARAVQERARRVGFEWTTPDGCFEKLLEEVKELKKAYKKGHLRSISEEIGDTLFTLVNLSRYLNLNPEEVLQEAIDKFISRFKMMEKKIKKEGKDLTRLSLNEMDQFWNKTKRKRKSPYSYDDTF